MFPVTSSNYDFIDKEDKAEILISFNKKKNKIEIVVDRMKRFNYSINNDIHKKKQFKNPSIYEKLIDVYGIDEFGSSFAEHVESLKSDGYMFYDELDSVQRAEWARIDKAKKERTKVN